MKKYFNYFGKEIIFSNKEFISRINKVKLKMNEKGIEVLLISNPANQFYLTGYDGWSFYTPQMVLIHINDAQPYWIGRRMDAVGAKFTSFLNKNHIVSYPDTYVASTTKHPMNFLVEFIKKKKWHKKNIGVEMDDYYYSAKWHQILKKNLSQSKFVDAFFTCELGKNDKIRSRVVIHETSWTNSKFSYEKCNEKSKTRYSTV